jgi:putative nucleotidyltransferase with HDIG domain
MSPLRDIDTLLDEIVTLPSLPRIIDRVNKLLEDPDVSLTEVGQVISTDPSVSLKTLRLINSAYYALREKVTSVEHAVVMLGSKVVRNLVMTATVFDSMKGGAESYIRHSICCGILMEILARHHRQNLPIAADEAFIFGLLHDVGKVIFGQFLPEECKEVNAIVATTKRPMFLVEREIIGADHAAIGSQLAHRWKLPDHLIQAIAGHHELFLCLEDSAQPLCANLTVADYICHACGISDIEGNIPVVDDETWRISGLKGSEMPKIMNEFFDALPNVDELMKLAA